MTAITEKLAAYAPQILLVVGALLAAGAVLTAAGWPIVGWTIYGAGYVGTLAAFPALAGLQRVSLDRFARASLAVLVTGIVLGLPVMMMMWGFYAQDAAIHDLLMPYAMTPVGMLAGVIAWLGLALFAIAVVRARVLPAGAGLLLLAAPLLALPADFGLVPQAVWAAAFVVLAAGMIWIALATRNQRAASIA